MTSKLKTDVLETVSGTGTIALTNQLTGMTSASVPSGSVLQVVSGTKSSVVTNSTGTYVDTGLQATITPTATSSRLIKIKFNIFCNTHVRTIYKHRNISFIALFKHSI